MDETLGKDDGRYMSKSFSGGPSSSILRDSNFARQTSNVSKITHRGYLLKRSNQPYIELNEDDIVDDPDEFPDLPIMPGIFANRNDNCLETRYTTITALPPTLSTSFVHSSMEVNPPKNSIDKGLDAAAAFFGLSLEEDKAQIQPMMKTEDLDHRPPTQNLPIEPPRQKSSEPIKFSTRAPSGKYQEGRSRRESFQDALHRRHSDPKMNTEDSDTMDEDVYYQSSSHPSDFVNPIDGHIWRSKYCVLDDGILYFYRNMTDGESSQAESERGEDLSAQRGSTTNRSTQTSKISDLSKSPMARNFFRHYDSNETNDSASFMWEKRVVLDCVGAVRSAEQEYGPNSFQLQGIDNDGTSSQPADTLVLRARDHDSMNEWIFQFHRALASYVKDIMEAFGQSGAYVHIDYPLSTSTAVMETLNRGSEEKLRRLMTRSPRLPHPIQSVPSLSHGHGKHAEYRRKANPLKPKTSPEIGLSTLENGGTAFSKVTSSKDTSPATNLVHTSPGRSPHEIFLLPPQSQKVEREPSSTSQIREGPLESNFSPSLPTNQCSSERGNIASARRYVPPSLRNRSHGVNNRGLRSLEERETTDNPNHDCMYGSALEGSVAYIDVLDNVEDGRHMPVQRGGCADPNLVPGSILDEANIPRNASKLEKCRSEAFGSYGGEKDKVFWETGAVSECGIRDSNEDAYLIAHDLKEALLGLTDFPHDEGGMHESTSVNQSSMGVWAIFDGHCGNQAARYAAENLVSFLREEFRMRCSFDSATRKSETISLCGVKSALHDALKKLDTEFCRICHEGGRDWESGTTALVALITDKSLIIANLGDCRGILCRSAKDASVLRDNGWNALDNEVRSADETKTHPDTRNSQCVWKEVSNVHKPSDDKEKARIESANGWVTTETEIPFGQFRRMDLLDEDVMEIMRRCQKNSGSTAKECKASPQRILHISRVCGELAVSRALGDRDFKAAYHTQQNHTLDQNNEFLCWDSPLDLSFPDDHSRMFHGDLVDNCPDFHQAQIGEEGSSQEFLLLASDGLWDVLDIDDAARVVHDLLFRREWTAKRAAARLAELAIHLGSSDNVTVIVVRIMDPAK